MIPEKDIFKDYNMLKITFINTCTCWRDYGKDSSIVITTYKPAIISVDLKALKFESGEIEPLPFGDIESIEIID